MQTGTPWEKTEKSQERSHKLSLDSGLLSADDQQQENQMDKMGLWRLKVGHCFADVFSRDLISLLGLKQPEVNVSQMSNLITTLLTFHQMNILYAHLYRNKHNIALFIIILLYRLTFVSLCNASCTNINVLCCILYFDSNWFWCSTTMTLMRICLIHCALFFLFFFTFFNLVNLSFVFYFLFVNLLL